MTHAWAYLLFIGNWFPHQLSEFGILWTVSIEEQFYLLFPLIFWAVVSFERWRWAIAIVLLLVPYLWRLTFTWVEIGLTPLYYLTLTYVDTFLLGSGAAVLYRRQFTSPSLFLERARHPLVGVALVVMAGTLGYLGRATWWAPYHVGTTLFYGSVSAVLTLILLWVVLNVGARELDWLRSVRSVYFRIRCTWSTFWCTGR